MYESLDVKGLALLGGIFAFTIYNKERDDWIAARDRYGVKPLYWIAAGDTWYLASEIKALVATGEDVRLI